ncbi:carbonate dehydratase [Planoprotostelium fungivorum]|uniref:Carbonic anhydrase n=1 Tax=Planoprotostelium fungivorum TaxID=1890364 RepID=A0A2P6N110_9EUKA|nr:carbonate dehydratase [Planoprotostelium fungivorum]
MSPPLVRLIGSFGTFLTGSGKEPAPRSCRDFVYAPDLNPHEGLFLCERPRYSTYSTQNVPQIETRRNICQSASPPLNVLRLRSTKASSMRVRLLLIVFIGCVLGQATNGTLPQAPDCASKNPTYLGLTLHGMSSAFKGNADNCLYAAQRIPGIGMGIINTLRIFVGVSFGILTLLTLYRLTLEFIFSQNTGDVSSRYIARWTMILLFFFCVWMTVQSADLFGVLGIITVQPYYVLYFFKDNLLLFLYSTLLFHWAELYHVSIQKLKKEEMLRKIKPGYVGNISVEDIIHNLNRASKFRFGYLFICILSLLVFVGMVWSQWRAYWDFYVSFYIISWVLCAAGYLLYGLKLLRIIPQLMKGKIITIMSCMAIFSVFAVTYACLEIVILIGTWEGLMLVKVILVSYALMWVCGFTAVNIFMPIWTWNRPSLLRAAVKGSTGDSSNRGTNRDTNRGTSTEQNGEVACRPLSTLFAIVIRVSPCSTLRAHGQPVFTRLVPCRLAKEPDDVSSDPTSEASSMRPLVVLLLSFVCVLGLQELEQLWGKPEREILPVVNRGLTEPTHHGTLQMLHVDHMDDKLFHCVHLLRSRDKSVNGIFQLVLNTSGVSMEVIKEWQNGIHLHIHASPLPIDLPFSLEAGDYPKLYIEDVETDVYVDLSPPSIDIIEENLPHERTKRDGGTAPSFNPSSIAVFTVNFQDASVPCDTGTIINGVWENTRAARQIFEVQSFSSVAFINDIEGDGGYDKYGPYTIPFSISDKCDPFAWSKSVQSIAKDNGVKISNYGYHMLILPPSVEQLCGWQGLGIIGPNCGGACLTWINTCSRPEVYLHELGHNMGMTHAGTNSDEAGYVIEYGDPTSYMGNSVWADNNRQLEFNVAHRDQVSWYNDLYNLLRFKVSDSSMNGVYRVNPLNRVNPAHPLGIQIYIDDNDMNYYVSYVTFTNPNANLMLVHTYKGSSLSYLVASLPVGQFYTSRNTRFSVTNLYLDDDHMDVRISYGCEHQDTQFLFTQLMTSSDVTPTVSLENVDAVLLSDAQGVNGVLSIYNADSPLCYGTNYSLSQLNVPPEWKVTYDPSYVFLTPGQNCSVNVRVQPSSNSSPARYPIALSFHAVNNDNSLSRSSNLSFSVSVSDSCQRLQPILYNTSRYVTIPPNGPSLLNFTLQDQSVSGCTAATVYLTVNGPAGIMASVSKTYVPLKIEAGGSVSSSLTITPSGPSDRPQNITLSVKNAESSVFTQYTWIVTVGSNCGSALPLVSFNYNSLSISAYQAATIRVNVTNADTLNCPSSQFIVTPADPTGIVINPPTVTLIPGQSAIVTVTRSALMNQATQSGSLQLTISDVDHKTRPAVEGSIPYQLNRVGCSYAGVSAEARWPDYIDLQRVPVLRNMIYIYNGDSWSCPESKFRLNVQLPSGLSWNWTLGDQNAVIPLAPGNFSGWIEFDIQVPSSYSQPTIPVILTLSDVANVQPHVKVFNYSIALQPCVRSSPIIQVRTHDPRPLPTLPQPPTNYNTSLFPGQSRSFSLSITNNDTLACNYLQIYEGSTTGATTFTVSLKDNNGSSIVSTTPTASLLAGATAQVTVAMGAVARVQSNTTTYVLKFRVDGNSSLGQTSQTFPYVLTVLSGCVVRQPTVGLTPDSLIVNGGALQPLIYNLTVTNNDLGPLCDNLTTFTLTFNPPTKGWTASADSITVPTYQNETSWKIVQVLPRTNLAVGTNFTVGLGVYDSQQSGRGGNGQGVVTTKCPTPSPPRGLKAQPIVPVWGFQMQAYPNMITWTSCERNYMCCCPCTWMVSRDGVWIGNTTTPNFTDTHNLVAGRPYLYSVSVVDRHGVASPASVCGNTLLSSTTPAMYKTLFLFMFIACLCMASFAGLLVGLYKLIDFCMTRHDNRVRTGTHHPARMGVSGVQWTSTGRDRTVTVELNHVESPSLSSPITSSDDVEGLQMDSDSAETLQVQEEENTVAVDPGTVTRPLPCDYIYQQPTAESNMSDKNETRREIFALKNKADTGSKDSSTAEKHRQFESIETIKNNNKLWAQSKTKTDPEFFERLKDTQAPQLLWVGCSDSRVPANQILGLAPGEVFVHRNIANVITHSDINSHSVIAYAVDNLKVRHILVVGHYGCGGVKASMTNSTFGLLDWWLNNIKDVYEEHREQVDACTAEKDKADLLCELNVVQSVLNVAKSNTLQAAWARGQSVSVHGFCYRLEDGILRDLGVEVSQPDQLDKVYGKAAAIVKPQA